MARSVKSLTVSVITKDLAGKSKTRSFKSIDPQITDTAVVGIANLVNTFDEGILQKPVITRVEEIDIAE